MSPLSQDIPACSEYLKKELKEVITKLAQESRKIQRVAESEASKLLIPRLEELLTWLENNDTTAQLRKDSKIDEGLALIHREGNGFYFDDEYVKRAKSLHEKWLSETRAGPSAPQNVAVKRQAPSSDEDDAPMPSPKRRSSAAPRSDSGTDDAMAGIKPPPTAHPIWGRDGIMHGMALKKAGRRAPLMNPEYKHLQRSAKVYGHNDITVGRWFPYQLCAVWHGAHGASQAGIYGDATEGAYSIIVSGEYEDLDHDQGNILFYSGSGSHSNTNPREPPASTSGTQSLHASLESGRPVRVLRSHSGRSSYAPTKGLRYDGLYRVTDLRKPTNMKGGRYEQFRLERISQEEDDLQIPIEHCKARPNGQDLRDYERIQLGYQSRR